MKDAGIKQNLRVLKKYGSAAFDRLRVPGG